MGWNLTLDVGIDCVSCHESDRCTDDCICPACWWPARYDPVERDLAADAWKFFAPVTKALNDAAIPWGWATEEGYQKKVTCSLEITIPATDEWCEVVRWGDKYVASSWTMTRGSREHNIAPEPVMLDELEAETPDEIVNFVENCILYRKEVMR